MSTIFGEEHFIDTTMINLIEQRNNAIDDFVFQQMENVITGSGFIPMPQVVIDKEKLKKWITLCMKLENIEQSELIDMATKKKITDLEAKLAQARENLIQCEADRKFEQEKKDIAMKRVFELKQQLAEYEAIKNKYKTIFLDRFVDAKVEDARIWKEEYDKLKQQLAEKEKEIEQWKSMTERSSSMLDRFNYCGESIVYDTTREQDKISFAVEKLVGVQKYISDNAVYIEEESFGREINDYIDNQIKQLKGMK